jgi:hypothetical protein
MAMVGDVGSLLPIVDEGHERTGDRAGLGCAALGHRCDDTRADAAEDRRRRGPACDVV